MLFSAGFEAGEEIGGLHFFAFRPIVIGVAFEAARFGVVRAGRVAGFAIREGRNKDIAGFPAGERAGMAADAGKSAVGIVIEPGMWHPSLGEAGFRYIRQRSAFHSVQRVTLLACFTPEKFFGVSGALRDLLRRR